MSIEQNISNNDQKKIITNEVTREVVPPKITSPEDQGDEDALKIQKKQEQAQQVQDKRAEVMGKFEGQEEKEKYPEGHILNPDMLDKIAQLEAIDPNTGEFNQERYEDYINSQARLGSYTVGENQKRINEAIQSGKELKKALRRVEVIYGQGGWNRYPINEDTGEVFLSRGISNTTGSPEYKAKLAQRAKELGIKVEEE